MRISRFSATFHFVFATRHILTLLEKVVVSGISGAAVGRMAGNPLAVAVALAFKLNTWNHARRANRTTGLVLRQPPEFRLISRRGAFDLARRLNRGSGTSGSAPLSPGRKMQIAFIAAASSAAGAFSPIMDTLEFKTLEWRPGGILHAGRRRLNR